MGKQRDPEQCRTFIQAINEGKNQKEASVLAGWSESAGSRYLADVRAKQPELLEIESQGTGLQSQENAPEKRKPLEEPKKMLSLNMTGYWDYVQTMAGYRRMSATKYIRELIAADMEMNRGKYERLKSI